MTEAEWLTCTDPRWLLEHLGRTARSRKLRLFVCACCRRAWPRIEHPVCRQAIEVAERFADRAAKDPEREQAAEAVRALCGPGVRSAVSVAYHAACGSRYTFNTAIIAAQHAVFAVTAASYRGERPAAENAERLAQCQLVHEIYGNPFRPVTVDPAWRTPAVIQLAADAYDERLLPAGHLDPVRLAVLADALEEAGCDNAEILAHLRGPGPHVRGCWALDLVLGKE